MNQQVESVKIDDVIISVELPPYFISPDMAKGMDYYPKYIEKALVAGKPIRTPASYINEILRQVGSTGERRTEILDHYSRHIGSEKVLKQMDEAKKAFNKAKSTKLYVRLTDARNIAELYPHNKVQEAIMKRLKDGESIMVEPIQFKEYNWKDTN